MNAVTDALASQAVQDRKTLEDGVAKYVAAMRHAGRTRTTVLSLLSDMDIREKDLASLAKIRDLLDSLTQPKDWTEK